MRSAVFSALMVLTACASEPSSKPTPAPPPRSTPDAAVKEETEERLAVPDASLPLDTRPDAAVDDRANDARLPKAPKGARVRTIHPLSPGGIACLEMYTACKGKPEMCTSAPFHLDCGQESALPGQKEWLRCVCP